MNAQLAKLPVQEESVPHLPPAREQPARDVDPVSWDAMAEAWEDMELFDVAEVEHDDASYWNYVNAARNSDSLLSQSSGQPHRPPNPKAAGAEPANSLVQRRPRRSRLRARDRWVPALDIGARFCRVRVLWAWAHSLRTCAGAPNTLPRVGGVGRRSVARSLPRRRRYL